MALLTLAVWLWRTSNPRAKSVAEAAAQVQVAEENLETAHRWSFATERAVRQAGLTNTARTVQGFGNKITSPLFKERLHAEIEWHVAQLTAIADCCVARFGELSAAQEAMATLSLSGIKDVIIRRPEGGAATADGRFDLMVAKSNEVVALSVLKEIQIFEAGQ